LYFGLYNSEHMQRRTQTYSELYILKHLRIKQFETKNENL